MGTSRTNRFVGWVVSAVLTGAVYWRLIRPWHLHWGARPEEVAQRIPGDGRPTPALVESTRVVSIDAPVSAVWPWLAQLGQGRGGFYSYSWLENLVGADIHNANRVLEAYQEVSEGDQIRLTREDYWLHSPATAATVSFVQPGETLALQFVDGGCWTFHLEPDASGRTRLLVRSRTPELTRVRSRLQHYVLFEVPHFVMERRMLLGIKARAERLAQSTARHR